MKYVAILFISVILLVLGYNCIFETKRIISKYIELAKFEESTKLYKTLMSDSNLLWTKLSGIFIIIFAVSLLVAMAVSLINKFS